MTNEALAKAYLAKANVRLRVLTIFFDAGAYSDVVREAQELVELALKAWLREVGIDPPKWHDVGAILRANVERLAGVDDDDIDRACIISSILRDERERSFYGSIDFIPTDEYDETKARRAMDDARFVLDLVTRAIA